MKKTLVIDYSKKYKRSALFEENKLVEVIIEDENLPIISNIYIGKIKRILKNKFAFLDIGFKQNAFLCLTDKTEQHLFTNDNKKNLKFKEGQNIIVQVKKQQTKIKGAMVSANISISGKYVVLLLNDTSINISKKIKDKKIKESLINIIQNFKNDFGIIFRTNCQNTDISYIKDEINYLSKQALNILKKSKLTDAPALIYQDQSEDKKIIRDYLKDEDSIFINNIDQFKLLKNTFSLKNIFLYEENQPIFEKFEVEVQIEKALNKKVWLKNGGFLIIDEIEAMTIIDVNSAKNIKKNFCEMILSTNLEAVYEILKQIRIRNISGMILIDFIDMKNKDHINLIFESFLKLSKNDRTPIFVLSMTELGLLQITRKKTRQSLKESLLTECPVCLSNGFVKNTNYIANTIKNRVFSIFSSTTYKKVVISSNKKIINNFKNNFDISEIEKQFNKKIELKIISTTKFDYFEIEKLHDI